MRTLIFISALLVGTWVSANTDFNDKLELISDGKIDKNQLSQWSNETLYPYYLEAWLTENITSLSQSDVDAFLSDDNNVGAAWFFRPKWRNELIRREDWPQINQQFADFNSAELSCYYFQSQVELGQKVSPSDVEKLWQTGRSQPDNCDPFFADWIASLDDPDPQIWDRQLKAFYSRNGTLLRYLNRFYRSDENRTTGEFLVSVYDEPKSIISKNYNPNDPHMRELALAAVNRMAFQDPRSASNLWLQIVKVTPEIGQDAVQEASAFLGIAMAKNALPEASYWLSIADPKREDEIVQHWRLQIALVDKDYYRILDYYQALSPELKTESQWRYWSGVARMKVEGAVADDNPIIALSTQRLYYGYLAAGVLGVPPSLNSNPQYAPIDVAAIANEPPLVRSKALYQAGDTLRGQVEWNLFVRQQPDAIQHAAAELAMSWGWYAKASQSAAWSGRYDLIHLRFPDAFGPFVEYHADQLDLPRYWVYGLMRQESLFEHTAVSSANAHGLMQILPTTAAQTARRYGIAYSDKNDLYDPSTNIEIGTNYMAELLREFGHPVFATAAYNAGPSRVVAWRERFPNEMTIWIESIPFDETRNYVKSVLAYSQIYAITTGEEWQLASWTTPATAFASTEP